MRALPLLACCGLLLPGCVSPPPPGPAAPPVAGGLGWALDCALGSFEAAANASWAQRCEARASHTAGAKQETWLAINPKDPNNVVIGAKDLNPESSNRCVWNGVFVTHDGGKVWKDVVIGGKWADRKQGDPYYGYACNTDPDFQFDAKGDVHYGVEMYNVANNGPCFPDVSAIPDPTGLACQMPGFKILLATSHDGGDTWPEVITFDPDLVGTTDYSRMTIVPTTQTILEAIGSTQGGCHVLRSADGGKSADMVAVAVGPYGPACNSGAGTSLAASPKGVAVIVGGYGSDVGMTGVVRSVDDGKTWTDPNPGFTFRPIAADPNDPRNIGRFPESRYRVGSAIELAYDLSTGSRAGTLYAVYSSADRDEADVHLRSSTDDGKTWSDAVTVNDDPPGPHQWMPNIAVAGDGSVHVFYMDKRHDPDHKLIDITHALSLDGGKTWRNERVSTLSYDGDLGKHQEGFPFIGDYLGVAAVGNDVWAGFPDASNGQSTVIAAAHARLL